MSNPFVAEPVALWEYLSLHTQTQIQLLSIPIPPSSSQTVTAKIGTEPSWELQILL